MVKLKKKRRQPIHADFYRRATFGAFSTTFLPRLRSTDPDDLRKYIRKTPPSFLLLLELVEPHLPVLSEFGRKSITHEEYLALTLRYLSTGESQTSIAIQYKIATCTVHKILSLTLPAIWKALQPIVLATPTADNWRRLAAEFELFWQLPFCSGAVDGKHVTMDCPNNSGSTYYNYKVI